MRRRLYRDKCILLAGAKTYAGAHKRLHTAFISGDQA
jgi:hypothetical protein